MADEEPVEEEKKPESKLVFIAALVLVSLVAVGGGWFVSMLLSPSDAEMAKDPIEEKFDKKSKDKNEAEGEEVADDASSEYREVVELEPILVALEGNSKVWVRMNLAVVGNEDSELGLPEVKARIASDITSLVKTLTLAQISGPSGFIHLKEDLLDRAKLTTDGQVEDLLVMSIVAE